MLGIIPRLLSKPLGHSCTTRAFWTTAKPYPHTLLRHEALRTVGSGRYKSTAAGDNKSGHIEAGKNEGIFFIDSEYPWGSLPSAPLYRPIEVMSASVPLLLLLESQGASPFDLG